MNKLTTSGILFASMMCMTAPALAQDAGKADDLSSRATAAYQAENYDEALDLFLQAYEIDSDPGMAYNVARAYEAKKDYANAEKFYRIFVEAPDVNLDARTDALQRIKLMRELAAVESGGSVTQPVTTGDGEGGAVATNPGDATQPRDPIAPVDPEEETGSSTQKSGPSPLTWVFLGGGALAIGAGATFGVLANQSANQLAESCRGENNTLCPESSSTTVDAMRSRALIADVSYATGGALLILGAVTWIVTSGKESESSAQFSPVLTPSTVGGTWSISF